MKEKYFMLCSQKVRETPCNKCLHFNECMKRGAPVSDFANYLGLLSFDYLPRIEAELNKIVSAPVMLCVDVPQDKVGMEEDKVYAFVRCVRRYDRRRLFKLLLPEAVGYGGLASMVFNAYFDYLLRKYKHGKH